MTRPWTGYLAGAAFALSAAAAGLAYAQAAPTDAHQDAARGERHVERQVIIRDGAGRRADQAERLRTMLQLKPSQEPALAAYLAVVAPERHHEHVVEMSTRGDGRDAPKTTPQRLAEMDARVNEQATQGHARVEATRKFYDQLEPSQKKVFDELPMLMVGPLGPMMPMGPMKVMVNMDGLPPLPPLPPTPPAPPRAPAPPRS